MSDRKKILWLVSWYPNKQDAFDGDFVQRHAKAAALYNDIHVIFIKDTDREEEQEEDWRSENRLTEQIIYFKRPLGLFSRFKKQMRWRKLFLKAADDYIKEYGEPHTVHVHVPWKAGLIALALKKKYSIPYVVTEHSGIYNNIVEDRFSNKPALVKKLTRQIFEGAVHLISVSRFLAEGINQMVAKTEYSVIPNTVDTSLFYHIESKYPVFTFIHVSNMVPLKNVSGILHAFQQLFNSNRVTEIQLILVGNRDDQFVNEARKLGLLNTHVFFRGEVPYKQVASEIQKAHCLVLNSDIENSPCVIGEALCCGLPVIATKVGGIPELVDETNSILLSPQSDGQLAKAMLKMYENYHDFNNQQIAQNAAERFAFHVIGQDFDRAYSAVN